MQSKFKAYLKIFLTCIWIGAQMFGSGMAVIPILQKEFIDKRKWITEEELLDIMSIAKCTPGAYTVNIVAFVGNKLMRLLGWIFCGNWTYYSSSNFYNFICNILQ